MEYFYRAIYHKICEMVTLKEEAVKQLNMIYKEMPDKREILNKPKEPLYVFPNSLNKLPREEEALGKWLSKWEVMVYLKISKSTYYRWRKEGILIPRNALGEDRYLFDDLKDIVKKRIT